MFAFDLQGRGHILPAELNANDDLWLQRHDIVPARRAAIHYCWRGENEGWWEDALYPRCIKESVGQGQVWISISKTRLKRWAQVIAMDGMHAGFAGATLAVAARLLAASGVRLPRPAGVTGCRSSLLGAKTPWTNNTTWQQKLLPRLSAPGSRSTFVANLKLQVGDEYYRGREFFNYGLV